MMADQEKAEQDAAATPPSQLQLDEIPTIREIQPTPEPRDYDEANFPEEVEKLWVPPPPLPQGPRLSQAEEEARIRQIEAALTAFAERASRATSRADDACELCRRRPLASLAARRCSACRLDVCSACAAFAETPKGLRRWTCTLCEAKDELHHLNQAQALRQANQAIRPKEPQWAEQDFTAHPDEMQPPVLSQMAVSPTSPKAGKDRRKATSRRRQEERDSDDSDATPESSDEDYPDEVIEVPPARPTLALQEVEDTKEVAKKKEQEDVLAQIASFSTSATEEFTISWTKGQEPPSKSAPPKTSEAPSASAPVTKAPTQPAPQPAAPAVATKQARPAEKEPRRNPFLASEEEEELEMEGIYEDTVTVQMKPVEEDEDEEYARAAKFYTNTPFYSHRPGPVYTIPEDEEEDEFGPMKAMTQHHHHLDEVCTSDEEDAYVAAVTGIEDFFPKHIPVVSTKEQIAAMDRDADEFVIPQKPPKAIQQQQKPDHRPDHKQDHKPERAHVKKLREHYEPPMEPVNFNPFSGTELGRNSIRFTGRVDSVI